MASRRLSPSSSSEDSGNETTENDSSKGTNIFRNDGSFLEMFKKMQNASKLNTSTDTKTSEPGNSLKRTDTENLSSSSHKEDTQQPKLTTVPSFMASRRRACKILPVGKVKKLKTEEEEMKQQKPPSDAWAKYLDEVKKYKETYCDSETKNRSLVK